MRFLLLTEEDDYNCQNDYAASLFEATQKETADSAAMVQILDFTRYYGARVLQKNVTEDTKLIVALSKYSKVQTIVLPDSASLEDILLCLRSGFLILPKLEYFVLKGQFTLSMELFETLYLHEIAVTEEEGTEKPSQSYINLLNTFKKRQGLEFAEYNNSSLPFIEEQNFGIADDPRNYILYGWPLSEQLDIDSPQEEISTVESRQTFKR